jgi:long-chain acyl-CoA synthetase
MSGYWRNPEDTAEVLHGEWVATGDLGYRDADGYYWIVDRKKDVIITGGFNVYPSEVETRLAAHPAVAEAAVIGLPHDDWGEHVHAAVTLREGAQASPEELIEYCRAALAGYKTPKGITIWAGPLPKNSSGKILKKSIREELEANRVESGS